MPRFTPALPLLAAITILLGACSEETPPADKPLGPTVDATVTALSLAPDPADLSPYEESLVEYEYRLGNVTAGDFPHREFRVAHWGVLQGEPAPVPAFGEQKTLTLIPFREVPGIANFHFTSDLDPLSDLPLFLDQVSYDALKTTPSGRRNDYGTHELSARMEIYWLVRHQLKLAVVGNSHAGTGIRPGAFYPTDNALQPVAISLASASSDFEMQHSIASNYLPELPQLEWVVWCLSPRLFNARYSSSAKNTSFATSSGRTYDRENAADLWPVDPDLPPVPVAVTEAVWNQRDAWGGSKHDGALKFATADALQSHVIRECSERKFIDNADAWPQLEAFLTTAQKKSINVFLFLPPSHPDTRHANCTDPDGTGHQDLQQITATLTSLAGRFPNTHFVDYNRSGQHGFQPANFYDIDHLNTTGADALTARIIAELAKTTPAVAE